MSVPSRRLHRARRWRLLAVVSTVTWVFAACASPPEGSVPLAEGSERLAELMAEAKSALPRTDERPITINPAKPCRRTFAGYAVGKTGGYQAEEAYIGWLDPGVDAAGAAEQVIGMWEAKGYEVTRLTTRADDGRFPKVVARSGDHELTIVAFRDTFVDSEGREREQVTLYGRSDCLEE